MWDHPKNRELAESLLAGTQAEVAELFPSFYSELRRLAHRQLARSGRGRGRTLNTTALVHEAYLKLEAGAQSPIESQRHFFALTALAMRQIIINEARQHRTKKRGGDVFRATFDESLIAVVEDADTLLAIDQALSRLESVDHRLVRTVECRYFAGLTEEETAEALGLSLRTVQRSWQRARAWLRVELEHGQMSADDRS